MRTDIIAALVALATGCTVTSRIRTAPPAVQVSRNEIKVGGPVIE